MDYFLCAMCIQCGTGVDALTVPGGKQWVMSKTLWCMFWKFDLYGIRDAHGKTRSCRRGPTTTLAEMGDGLSVPVRGHQVVESLSQDELQHMRAAIDDAHVECSIAPVISMVFESDEPQIVPGVPCVLGYVEPKQRPTGHAEPAVAIRPRAAVYEHATSFDSRRSCHLEESERGTCCHRNGRLSFPSIMDHLTLALS